MALKDILVVVDNTKAAAKRIDYAAGLAIKHDAHLTGLYVKSPPQVPAFVMANMPAEVKELQQKMLDDLADEARRLFDGATGRAGYADRSQWQIARGDAEMAAELLVRYSDLVIAGQPDPDDDDRLGLIRPHDLILGGGRPVMLVPYAYTPGRFGERVLVAWNGSRESARAVADAIPLLEAADHVTVLAINPSPELGDEPGADITLHLARHGIKAEASHMYVDDLDVSDALLNRTADLSIDTIVMGAYGRPRLRELVLGSLTSHMLEHMTVPVLMSH